MKIFISWSGPISQDVAIAFKEWLPFVVHGCKPFVSSEDIYKGSTWHKVKLGVKPNR